MPVDNKVRVAADPPPGSAGPNFSEDLLKDPLAVSELKGAAPLPASAPAAKQAAPKAAEAPSPRRPV